MLKRTQIAFLLLILSCGSSPSDPGDPGPADTNMLNEPANGETVTGPEVTFEWDAVSGATTYYHQIDTDQSMQNPVQNTSSSPTVTVTPESAGTWWWRVRTAVEGQTYYTEWSDVWSFTLI